MSEEASSPPPSPSLHIALTLGVMAGCVGLGIWRAIHGALPHDLSAYVSAADLFAAGANPYTSYAEATHYAGYPYVYPPGTLWVIAPLSVLPATLVVVGEAALRGVLTWRVTRHLTRIYGMEMPWQILTACLLLYQPYLTDVWAGNIAILLFWGWLEFVQHTKNSMLYGVRGVVAGVVVGVLVAFKPTWMLPVGWALICAGHLRVGAGALCAVMLIAALGWVPDTGWYADWWGLLEETRAHWASFGWMSVSPWLWGLLVAAWSGVAVWVWRHRREQAWLWGAASIVVWPHANIYSYLLVLPLALAVLMRWIAADDGVLMRAAKATVVYGVPSAPVGIAMSAMLKHDLWWRGATLNAWALCVALVWVWGVWRGVRG